MALTERQAREVEYHKDHAKGYEPKPLDLSVCAQPERRWWNGYWSMFAELKAVGVRGKRVLVVGCGFGEDALRLASMGADVSAFDLSAESLEIARASAVRERLQIRFDEM